MLRMEDKMKRMRRRLKTKLAIANMLKMNYLTIVPQGSKGDIGHSHYTGSISIW
ncbi:MAG: hypothetical protein NXI22_10715 [bacterium]|nr:hypothetical protein [bacterium]